MASNWLHTWAIYNPATGKYKLTNDDGSPSWEFPNTIGMVNVYTDADNQADGDTIYRAGGAWVRKPFASIGAGKIREGTPVNAVVATLTTTLGIPNAELIYTARTKGAAGNAIRVKYVNSGDYAGTTATKTYPETIQVWLKCTGGVSQATADDVKAAIAGNMSTNEMVIVEDAPDNDGSGIVEAMEYTFLEGGVDGTVGTKGDCYADDTYLYIAKDDNTTADSNWRRIDLGSAY
jgi:hypothetical protein